MALCPILQHTQTCSQMSCLVAYRDQHSALCPVWSHTQTSCLHYVLFGNIHRPAVYIMSCLVTYTRQALYILSCLVTCTNQLATLCLVWQCTQTSCLHYFPDGRIHKHSLYIMSCLVTYTDQLPSLCPRL